MKKSHANSTRYPMSFSSNTGIFQKLSVKLWILPIVSIECYICSDKDLNVYFQCTKHRSPPPLLHNRCRTFIQCFDGVCKTCSYFEWQHFSISINLKIKEKRKPKHLLPISNRKIFQLPITLSVKYDILAASFDCHKNLLSLKSKVWLLT